ncbi:DUF4174 domain-containing protein [Rhodobaculum claviforme]|uniref:Thioredoxin domain-containing protein n=1 Tax=Rhodobaculum claviforme TaxID=1549854 RepID=A0A934TN91_9RHOB|nr:DUF4174 domain-containing protein [Rhodobaculum claviforme]MBK5928203.1 hypothetical protein [Rhodobaculum claviforme]
MKLLPILATAFFLPAAALAQGSAQAADGASPTEALPTETPSPETLPPETRSTEMQPTETLPDDVASEAVMEEVDGLLVIDGAQADIDSFLWQRRLLLIFANTPADPAFQQQLQALLERAQEFVDRDVVVITDTDPDARSSARQRLRPRGFMVAIIDKDGEIKQRRPAPRSAREIMAVIDRFPLRRQEMLENRPSGRD